MPGPLDEVPIRLPEEAAAAWASGRCAVMPGLVPPALAAVWEVAARPVDMRDTFVGTDTSATWKEQPFLEDRALPCGGLACDAGFLASVAATTGVAAFDSARTVVWINRYRPGDRVPAHRDADGDCQLLLCLQALPETGFGGELMVGGRPVRLQRGDAVLWHARTLEHEMTPIASSAVGPSGFSRVVFVIRLFATGRSVETGAD